MSGFDRVIWYEGMALKPHHFQQHDRFVCESIHKAPSALGQYGWGINNLSINQNMLKFGKLAIDECSGAFADGTLFDFPHQDRPPAPIEIDQMTKDTVVYLAIPSAQYGMPNTDLSVNPAENVRFGSNSIQVNDQNVHNNTSEDLQVASLNTKILLGSESRDYYECVGVAKIKEVNPDKVIILDNDYIPPCILVSEIPQFKNMIGELAGLIHNRGEALSLQLNDIANSTPSELTDYMILQFINTYEVQLKHCLNKKNLHPENFYQLLLGLMAEFATYTFQGRRPIEVPVYRHDDLQATFSPVLSAIRISLSSILEQNSLVLPLTKQDKTTHVARIEDATLLEDAMFVLVAKTSLPQDELNQLFPSKIKLAPVEKIHNYVVKAIPGIPVRPLSSAPRQLPLHSGASYFEIDKHNPLWQSLTNSGGLAVHISGKFVDLVLELWAIKGG